jgi:DNA (cytosine-5)-methyltransferase 1
LTGGTGAQTGQDLACGALVAGTVSAKWAKGSGGPSGDEAQNLVAHTLRADGFDASEDGTGRGPPLTVSHASAAFVPGVASAAAVRRLTPRECERLQGLPDDWTLVPWRAGLAADGPRYKAIGNGQAVNVMRWIGRRIELVEHIGAVSLRVSVK